ncbi:MAG: sugar ABC transporter ATP-binding protein [Candidatus Hadarchaeota archaeon]
MSAMLSTESITKEFPGVKALEDVSITLESGTIYSLVGENGAGKSTLIRIIMGVYEADEGQIFIDGEEVDYDNALEALLEHNIACVHQESTLVPDLSIAENLFLEVEDRFYSSGTITESKIREKVEEIFDEFGLEIDVTRKASTLTPDEERMVELAKALYYDPDVLILDEITAPLSEDETDVVFEHMKELKQEGKTVLFISHRMEEVLEMSDEAVVLKDGKKVGKVSGKDLNREQLVKMMVGEESARAPFPDKSSDIKDNVIFEVRDLQNDNVDVSFEVREGEILALSGLKGQGMSEVLQMIYGVKCCDSGKLYLKGEELDIEGPKESMENGIIYISDDKDREELWSNLSVKENMIIPSFRKYSNKLGILDESGLDELVSGNIDKFDIKTPSIRALVNKLSGGNRQKVVFGKWLSTEPKVILANRPAIGLDVGAKKDIYHILRDLANQGIAVVTFLSELPEVVNLPDRVLVMRDGMVVEELEGDIDEESVMRAYFKEVNGTPAIEGEKLE